MTGLKLIISLGVVSAAACNDKHQQPDEKRELSAANESVYDVILPSSKGKYLPPKSERRKPNKPAVVRFWRGRRNLSVKDENGKCYLYFEDKQLLRTSEIKDIAAKE